MFIALAPTVTSITNLKICIFMRCIVIVELFIWKRLFSRPLMCHRKIHPYHNHHIPVISSNVKQTMARKAILFIELVPFGLHSQSTVQRHSNFFSNHSVASFFSALLALCTFVFVRVIVVVFYSFDIGLYMSPYVFFHIFPYWMHLMFCHIAIK